MHSEHLNEEHLSCCAASKSQNKEQGLHSMITELAHQSSSSAQTDHSLANNEGGVEPLIGL